MDRKLAQRTVRTGLIAGASALLIFGLTFVLAASYIY